MASQVKATKQIKPVSEYTEEELKEEGKRKLEREITQRLKQREQFEKNKDLTYARKRTNTAQKALIKLCARVTECARREHQEVQKANRQAVIEKTRGTRARDFKFERHVLGETLDFFENRGYEMDSDEGETDEEEEEEVPVVPEVSVVSP